MSLSPPAYRLVLPLGVGMILSFASSYYLMGVMAEPMAATTGASTTQLFGALSVAFLISAFCSLIAGRWTDRRGGREVLVVAALLFVLALGIMATAQGPLTAMLGVAALGFGMGIGFYTPANALLVRVYGMEAKRPLTALSLLGACGGAVGWPLSQWLIGEVGWRGTCMIWAASHLVIAIPLYLACLPKGGEPREVKDHAPVRWNRAMILMALMFAGAWWVATACAAQMPRVMMALGLDGAQAAMAAATMALSALAVRILLLVVPMKTSPLAMVRGACLLHPLGVGLALMGGKPWAVLVSIGQGAGNGLLSVAASVLPLHIFGPTHYGQRQALVLLPARFAQAFAPVSFALVMDQSVGMALGLTSLICVTMFGLTLGLVPRAKAAVRLMPDRA